MKDFNQKKYINDFMKKTYDRTTILTPKGRKEQIKEAARMRGMSMNEFIISLIDRELESET